MGADAVNITPELLYMMARPELRYGAAVLSRLEVLPLESGTLRTDSRRLAICAEYFNRCDPLERAGVLMHEACHVAFGHCHLMRHIAGEEGKIACDMAVHSAMRTMIESGVLKFPGTPCRPSDEGFDEDLTADQYFRMLTERKNRNEDQDPDPDPEPEPAESEECDDDQDADPGERDEEHDGDSGDESEDDDADSGGDAGEDGDGDDDGSADPGPGAGGFARDSEGRGLDSDCAPFDGEDGEGISDDAASTDRLVQQAQTLMQAEAMGGTSRGIGAAIAAGVLRDIEKAGLANWKSQLRRFWRETMTQRRSSYAKANKRHLWRGIIYPSKVPKSGQNKFVFAVDTSSSVSNALLRQLIGEINAIVKTLGGSTPRLSVRIIQFTSRVSFDVTYSKGDFPIRELSPLRGGTCVGPVFDLLSEDVIPPRGLVVVTDGFICDWPSRGSVRYPVLSIQPDNGSTSCPVGQTVRFVE